MQHSSSTTGFAPAGPGCCAIAATTTNRVVFMQYAADGGDGRM
jgi:hypothetical protein